MITSLKDYAIGKLKGLSGGHDDTYFKVLDIQPTVVKTYPSIKDGKEVNFWDKDYAKYKTTVEHEGYSLTVSGNAISCEETLINLGYKAFACSPNKVDLWSRY